MPQHRHRDPPKLDSARSAAALDLVLADRTRLPLSGNVTIGRGRQNTLTIHDSTVSRRHAGISFGRDGPLITDLGSSYGTWVDGERISKPTALADGSRIRVGDQRLIVERRRSPAESGLTRIVQPDRRSPERGGERVGPRPRLKEGTAVKRLAASEGSRRYVLKEAASGNRVRLSDDDHRLLQLLDGNRTLPDLVAEAKRRFGDDGPARLTRLLTELASRGFLADVDAEQVQRPGAGGLFRVRERHWRSAGKVFERGYAMGGRLLLARPLLLVDAVIIVLGLCVFPYLILARYGTPFVVVHHVGLGGLVFVAGRLLIGATHETAHALVLASFGRRVATAGVKLVLIFPYFYVDTSDAWFENRRRRIAVSAAGPASDLILGGVFSLCSLRVPAGALRDVLFQLAFGAYLGGLFNLNPFLERDGYHMLVDVLGQPGLRGRAQAELRQVLGGQTRARFDVLTRYALFGLAWSTVAAGFGVVMSLRYEHTLSSILPVPLTWGLLFACWVVAFMPVFLAVAPPLIRRVRLPGA